MAHKIALALAALSLLAFTSACILISTAPSFAGLHLQYLGPGRPECTDCHAIDEPMTNHVRSYAEFNHSTGFLRSHGIQAAQYSNVCAACHSHSFCSDCHPGKTVMKPALKHGSRPDRMSPHKGDYMFLHRVEGRMDPSACFKCHGRAANDRCRACHR
jgi:hypothetical protein